MCYKWARIYAACQEQLFSVSSSVTGSIWKKMLKTSRKIWITVCYKHVCVYMYIKHILQILCKDSVDIFKYLLWIVVGSFVSKQTL